VIGFDPLAGELRFEVTTPLLFANLLRWLSPEAFRQVEISAGRVGLASATLNPKENADHIRVEDEAGRAVPFTVREQTLQLFASRPGVVRVTSDSGERVLSLTLPDVAEYEWKPPANVAQGLPPSARWLRTALDLWKWLALLGAVGLFTEWMLYGRQRTLRWRGPVAAQPGVSRAAREREVVSK
jgi:hypothetical protein